VLTEMWETGATAEGIVREKGLAQVSDTGVLEESINAAMAANQELVNRYAAGEDKLLGVIMGKVMGELKGRGNPQLVKQLLTDKLNALRG